MPPTSFQTTGPRKFVLPPPPISINYAGKRKDLILFQQYYHNIKQYKQAIVFIFITKMGRWGILTFPAVQERAPVLFNTNVLETVSSDISTPYSRNQHMASIATASCTCLHICFLIWRRNMWQHWKKTFIIWTRNLLPFPGPQRLTVSSRTVYQWRCDIWVLWPSSTKASSLTCGNGLTGHLFLLHSRAADLEGYAHVGKLSAVSKVGYHTLWYTHTPSIINIWTSSLIFKKLSMHVMQLQATPPSYRFYARSQNCDMRWLASSRLLCPHGTTRLPLNIFMKFNIWGFFCNLLRNFKIH